MPSRIRMGRTMALQVLWAYRFCFFMLDQWSVRSSRKNLVFFSGRQWLLSFYILIARTYSFLKLIRQHSRFRFILLFHSFPENNLFRQLQKAYLFPDLFGIIYLISKSPNNTYFLRETKFAFRDLFAIANRQDSLTTHNKTTAFGQFGERNLIQFI